MKKMFKNAWLWLQQKARENKLRIWLTVIALPGLVRTGIKDDILLLLTIMALLIAHYARPLKKNEKDQD